MDYLKVPLSRVGAIIGPKGETKKRIEELSGCEINIDSNEGIIEITSKNKALPKTGVYWVSMVWKNQIYFGMLNFGVRPSVSSKKHTIEIHFFNFDENIYDETINISFHVKIRDEKKFDSLESLRKQLEIDKKFCYELEKTN